MSVSVQIEDDVQELCSSSAWVEFCRWVEPLPFSKLGEFVALGEVEDTRQLQEELRNAASVYPPSENVGEIVNDMLAFIGIGGVDEVMGTVA